MNEFTKKIDRLIERLQGDVKQCDRIEQRACDIEERLLALDQSVQTLARLMEISSLLLISTDQDKQRWLQCVDDEDHPDIERFLSRLECYLRREMIDGDERRAYLQALVLLQSPLLIASGFFLKLKNKQ